MDDGLKNLTLNSGYGISIQNASGSVDTAPGRERA